MDATPIEAKGIVTQMTAINLAKVLTVICLGIFALIFGISDERQVVYLCLHGGYCLWWLLEQWLFPTRKEQLFTEKVDAITLSVILLFVGVFYALPGYFAFSNPYPLGFLSLAIALLLYVFGSLINTSADIQKMTAKELGAGLVSNGIWRLVRHVNYLGDLMRYTSFAVVAGSPWAYVLPGIVALQYLQRINQKETAMAAKYDGFKDYQQRSSRLIPGIW